MIYYRNILSFILILLLSNPLGMSALKNDGKPLFAHSNPNDFPVPEEVINNTYDKLLQSLEKFRFNGTALVAVQNQVIFEKARGFADFKTKNSISLESSFQLASVSKSFTALSIMILKERKLLDYDDLITKYLPDFPYPDISIRHLLNHTSGLQNYMFLVDNYWQADKPISNQEMLNLMISHNLPLNYLPGRRFAYSNTGYAILALVTEKISGQYFGDFLKVEIFDKLGMTQTYVYDRSKIEQDSNQVIGYNASGRRLHAYYHDPNNEILGDKSVYSSVGDLFKFTKALNKYEIVSKEILDEAYTSAKLKNYMVNYGFGWRMKEENNHNYIFHNGAWHGFSTTITQDLDKGITLVLLNNTNASIETIKQELLNIIHEGLDPYLRN